jgi:hypothetical protein
VHTEQRICFVHNKLTNQAMNSKLALSAVVMIAAIMVFGAISPAMAAPNENASDRAKERAGDKGNDKAKAGKVSICHWQEEVLDDPDTTDVDESEPAEWVVINVSANAQKAHVDKHTDGTDVDTLIDDSDEPAADTITTEGCLDRNTPEPVPEEVPVEIPIE